MPRPETHAHRREVIRLGTKARMAEDGQELFAIHQMRWALVQANQTRIRFLDTWALSLDRRSSGKSIAKKQSNAGKTEGWQSGN